MEPIKVEVTMPLSTIALCLIAGGTAVALASLTFAVVGLYAEVKRLREKFAQLPQAIRDWPSQVARQIVSD